MSASASVVVVGGGLAATRTVEELRSSSSDVQITMVSAESELPYDRPPLSKSVLRGEKPLNRLREQWDDLDVTLLLGRRAVRLDPGAKQLHLDDGTSLTYDSLVLATGAAPRTLAGLAGDGVHVLRTAQDAAALGGAMRAAGSLVVLGGGFIGCEVAASARMLDLRVDLVEVLSAPLAGVLGPQLGAEVAVLHEGNGVRLHTGTRVEQVRGTGADRELVLSSGSVLPAPVVLVGLGVAPDTAWLAGTGLEVDHGVLCNATGRTSVPGVWAAGDVACWYHPSYRRRLRLEHWSSAAEQAATVARDVALGAAEPLAEVPYFWSDQYATKFQVLGRPHADDDLIILKVGPKADRLLALYSRQGRLTAVLGASAPRWVMALRDAVRDAAPVEQAVALSTS